MDGAGAGIQETGPDETGPYEKGLGRTAANTAPLTPVTFLRRAAAVYPHKLAVVHGSQRFTYAQFHARACRLASALARRGLVRGDCVAILCPNTPAMLEAHYGVPMLGGVLNSLNIRLDARTLAFILEHGEAKRSEEHTSQLQSLMRISYAVFCLKKKKIKHIDPDAKHK